MSQAESVKTRLIRNVDMQDTNIWRQHFERNDDEGAAIVRSCASLSNNSGYLGDALMCRGISPG